MVTLESEKELEEFLLQSLAKIPNLTTAQQVKLGNYGVADIISWSVLNVDDYYTLYVHIIEAKKDNADHTALSQLCRYMKAVEGNLIANQEHFPIKINEILVHGALVCRKIINMTDFGYILAQMQNVFVYKYNLSLEKGLETQRWAGWMRGRPRNQFNNKPIIPTDQLAEAVDAVTDCKSQPITTQPFFLL